MFMPVGTAGTVKSIDPDELKALGYGLCLSNTYHLMLRPGHERVRALGGLHRMMAWGGALLTDSGGFQAFSLSDLSKMSEQGVEFRSHHDGSKHLLTPESAVAIQEALGADIIMAFDHCAALPAERADVEDAVRRTTAWLQRCVDARTRTEDQALFGIVQGGIDPELRRRSVEEVCAFDLPGFAIGGLSVGESVQDMWDTARLTAPLMPADKPRYLMGVGKPDDLIEGVKAGVDMFDCVLPTRAARTGLLFTSRGDLVLKNARWKDDPGPPDPRCDCPCCSRFSLAYLRHLLVSKEILGVRLLTLHNLALYKRLMEGLRAAILDGSLDNFVASFRAGREELGSRIRRPQNPQ
jgi:queuine tRNA-ribosyltransferase